MEREKPRIYKIFKKERKSTPLFCLFAQEAAVRLPKGLLFLENPAEFGVFLGGGH
jgi:hypothetical protein